MRLVCAIVVGLMLAMPATAKEKPDGKGAIQSLAVEDIGTYLQTTSVNVKASKGGSGGTEGSGTVFLVKRKDGEKPAAFVLTAHHVVDGLREVSEQIIGGDTKKHVRYRDAVVVREVPNEESTRVVGDSRLDCKVISVDPMRDIALLRVRAIGKFEHSGKFYLGDKVVPVGTPILHVGCPGGQDVSGTGSVRDGIVSRIGARIPEYGGAEHGVFDYLDCSSMGGSSGGMVCRASTGEWVGMITLGLGSGGNFCWMVPVRSVREWAKEINAEWLLDPEAEVTQAQIDQLPLENHPEGLGTKEKDGGKESRYRTMELRSPVRPLYNILPELYAPLTGDGPRH